MAEREHSKQPVLTPTQIALGNSMMSALDNLTTSGQRGLFVVNGLSGVGKTVVLEGISPIATQKQAHVILSDSPCYDMEKLQEEGFQGSIFVAETNERMRSISEIASKAGLPMMVFTLPGMDEKEAGDYLETLSISGNRVLTPDQIITYSLGIPLLMQEIATPGITEAMAARIAAKYLQMCLPQAWRPEVLREAQGKYLNIVPNEKVLHALNELAGLGKDQIYDDLYMVMTRREEIAKRTGIVEESPLFVAPESEAIYNAMLQKKRDSDTARIEIFVPGLGKVDFNRIKQALGHQYGGYYDQGDRVDMFLANFRKVNMWFREGRQGQAEVYIPADKLWVANAEEHERALKAGKYPFLKSSGENIFFIHTHDHEGMICNPARIGWMMESLLQQRGIPYLVDNYTLNQEYYYEPAQKRIIPVKNGIIVSVLT